MNSFLSPIPRIVAHRGDSKNFPENTIEAFLSAEKMKIDVIETDVHITKDGYIVIWHDDTLERATNKSGRIENQTLSEIKKADAGYNYTKDGGKTFPFRGKGIKIATLEEALLALPDTKFNIDLKTNDTKIVLPYIKTLEKCRADGRVCTASFHLKNLTLFRKERPSLLTSLTTMEILPLIISSKLRTLPPSFDKKIILQVPVSQWGIKIVTEKFVNDIHRRGGIIMVWTINEKEEMKRLFSLGVDSIMTDDPALLIETLNELRYP